MSIEWAVGIIVVTIVMVGWWIVEQLRLITERLGHIAELISEMKWQWDADAGRNELRYRASRSARE